MSSPALRAAHCYGPLDSVTTVDRWKSGPRKSVLLYLRPFRREQPHFAYPDAGVDSTWTESYVSIRLRRRQRTSNPGCNSRAGYLEHGASGPEADIR